MPSYGLLEFCAQSTWDSRLLKHSPSRRDRDTLSLTDCAMPKTITNCSYLFLWLCFQVLGIFSPFGVRLDCGNTVPLLAMSISDSRAVQRAIVLDRSCGASHSSICLSFNQIVLKTHLPGIFSHRIVNWAETEPTKTHFVYKLRSRPSCVTANHDRGYYWPCDWPYNFGQSKRAYHVVNGSGLPKRLASLASNSRCEHGRVTAEFSQNFKRRFFILREF